MNPAHIKEFAKKHFCFSMKPQVTGAMIPLSLLLMNFSVRPWHLSLGYQCTIVRTDVDGLASPIGKANSCPACLAYLDGQGRDQLDCSAARVNACLASFLPQEKQVLRNDQRSTSCFSYASNVSLIPGQIRELIQHGFLCNQKYLRGRPFLRQRQFISQHCKCTAWSDYYNVCLTKASGLLKQP
jgi:hypothetical protein